MFKKILIIIIIILVLIALALSIRIYLNDSSVKIENEESTERGGIFGFLGFGDNATGTDDTQTNSNQNTTTDGDRPVEFPTLRQITTEPTAGATFVGTSTIRYVDRGTGHIYETSVDSYDTVKISNDTLPKVYNAYWLVSGNAVVYQQLSDSNIVKTSLLTLIKDATASTTNDLYEVSMTFLPDNITNIATSPTTDEIAYLTNQTSTNSSLIITDGANISSTASIPGTQWILDWLTPNSLSLTTKASAEVVGYSYTSTRNGSLTRIMGDQRGLTAKTKDSFAVFSNAENSNLTSGTYNVTTGSVASFIPNTLPEKCVFFNTHTDAVLCGSPQALPIETYPDSWYQGKISFDDNIVLYDLVSGVSSLPYIPQTSVDLLNPRLSSDDQYLLFINKKDLTLWALNVQEALE